MIEPQSPESASNQSTGAESSSEKISDQETEKTIIQLAETLAKSLILESNFGLSEELNLFQLLEQNGEEMAGTLADIVARHFIFLDYTPGKHSIADTMDVELENVQSRYAAIQEVIKIMSDEANYTAAELADKQKRDQVKELEAEIDGLVDESAESNHQKIEELKDQLMELHQQIELPLIPSSASEIYAQTEARQHHIEVERDCKVPAVVLGYLVKYFKDKFHAPVEVRFATVRAKPHPFVEVRFGEEENAVAYYDFMPDTDLARKNPDEIMKVLAADKRARGLARPAVRFQEVTATGLAQLDTDYLNHKRYNA